MEIEHVIAQNLSARVEDAILKVLGNETDELDGPSFDAVEFVNRKYADDRSLDGLDKAIAAYDAEIKELDESILETVREQSTSGALAQRDIADAKDSIGDLHAKIIEIKKKSEASEQLVQDICKDIKQLDVAKRHLTNSILTLARLKTLTEAVGQLQVHTAAKSYDEAAPVLEAAIHVFTFFADYSRVPKVSELAREVESVRGELSEMIRQDFEDLIEAVTPQDMSFQEGGGRDAEKVLSLTELHSKDESSSSRSLTEGQTLTLSAACECIDSLGPKERKNILRSFNGKQLKSYKWIFRPNSQLGDALESIDKRYAWFRRSLSLIEDKFGRVLPKRWRVAHRLCVEYCESTRTDVERILNQFDPPSSAPPELLLRALLKTIAFEKEMSKRFESGDLKVESSGPSAGQGAFNDEDDEDEVWDESAPLYNDKGELVDPSCAEGIKLKYKRKKEFEERKAKRVEKKAQRAEQRKVIAKLAGVEETGRGRSGASSHENNAPSGIGSVGRASITEEIAALPKIATPGEGIISAAFKPYMASYVKYERQKIDSAVQATVEEDAKSSSAGGAFASVLRSATQLFAQSSNAVGRCVQLSTGQTLFDLFEETNGAMASYAQDLQDRMLPRPAPSAAGQLPGETYTFTNEADIPRLVDSICLVINTSEYCAETVPKFAESVQKMLDSAYREHVIPSSENTQQVFYSLSVKALKTLSGVVACVLDASLLRMSKDTDWSRVSQVADQSTYVTNMQRPMRLAFSIARRRLDETRFRKFSQDFAEPSVRRYQASIYRCRQVSEVGAQQLLLDAQTIRSMLLEAPRTRPATDRVLTCIAQNKPIEEDDENFGSRGEGAEDEMGNPILPPAPPASYTRTVQKEMQSAELLLKIIAAPPPDRLREMIKVHWPSASAEQLIRVMEIKGMTKKEQQEVLVSLGLFKANAFVGTLGFGFTGASSLGTASSSGGVSNTAPSSSSTTSERNPFANQSAGSSAKESSTTSSTSSGGPGGIFDSVKGINISDSVKGISSVTSLFGSRKK
jgi:vacuolar protein sorting-associated protein 53